MVFVISFAHFLVLSKRHSYFWGIYNANPIYTLEGMKPFIAPDILPNGKEVLRYQCEDLELGHFLETLSDLRVVAYSMPVGHSFQAAWVFRLIFNTGSALEFSSTSTMVGGWFGVGSLNMRFVQEEARSSGGGVMDRVEVPSFQLTSMAKLVCESDVMRSECGIVFGGEAGQEIVVTTGVPPGSVSIAAPFSSDPFEPEFAVSQCGREYWQTQPLQ